MPPTGPALPAPDTPAVPLSVLLADTGLGLQQIAGPREDRLVSLIGTTELEDPAPYLLGGELLLIAGIGLPQTADGIDTYVRRVVEAGGAALGFGVAPVHDEVPPDLIAACDAHELPLLRIPPGTPFVAVNHAAHSAMAEARHRELRQISEAQATLAAAAVRPDALQAVLRQLAERLGAWTVLLDPHGNELFSAGTRPAAAAPERLRDLAVRTTTAHVRSRPTTGRAKPPTAAAEHHAGFRLTVHTLPGESTGGPLALGIADASAPTTVTRSVTGIAIVLLSLLTNPRHALGTDTRSAAALVRLMLGQSPVDVGPLLRPATRTDHWVVVHGRLTRPLPGVTPRPGGDPAQLAALGTALATPHLDVDGISLRALIPTTPAAPPPDLTPVSQLGWTLGLSSPVTTSDLPLAGRQAERMLRHALATGLPLAQHRDQDETMHSLVRPADASALAQARFAPLADAPAPGPGVLLETLRTWLAHHGSWDRTAAALELHRNTVRRRIAKITELLDADLEDLDVRMELWFALRWLPGEHPDTIRDSD